jgi:hypothetical protein
MPVGECQDEFGEAAAADGVRLTSQSFDWLCEQGHVGLLRKALASGDSALLKRAEAAAEVLATIFLRLGGDLAVLETGRTNRLRGDYVHEESGTLIEIDEEQHFTSFRLTTLNLYPEDVELGFDLREYKDICRRCRFRADKYRATKEARGFGAGGRQRQRAYYDALRDLATPAMGHPPLIRIPAPHGNGTAAYEARRDYLWDRLTLG